MKIVDVAKVIAPKAKQEIIGIRSGEKLHEQMISAEDSYTTYEYLNYFKILPTIYDLKIKKNIIKNGIKVPEHFNYNSQNNSEWMEKKDLQAWIDRNEKNILIS